MIPKAWSGVESPPGYNLRELGETPRRGDLVRLPGNREEGRPWKWTYLGKGMLKLDYPIIEDRLGCTHYPIAKPRSHSKKERPSTTEGSPVSAPSMYYPARQNNGRFRRVSHSIGSELK